MIRPTGKVKSIGVSNFSIKTLDILLPHCSIIPATNQVELHPSLPQFKLKEYCESRGILLTAYSSLGGQASDTLKRPFLDHAVFKKLANELGCTVGQVALSWGVQRGTAVLLKSESEERLKANLQVCHSRTCAYFC